MSRHVAHNCFRKWQKSAKTGHLSISPTADIRYGLPLPNPFSKAEMNKILLIAALAVAAYFALLPDPGAPSRPVAPDGTSVASGAVESFDAALENAYAKRLRNYQVEGQGIVAKLLPDDNDGSRHQRFIIRLNSGRTLLVAHNIDLAPRIDTLQAGDVVDFYGEYEWNQKGGVMHWTHHDPQGRHTGGWLKHNGRTYQ